MTPSDRQTRVSAYLLTFAAALFVALVAFSLAAVSALQEVVKRSAFLDEIAIDLLDDVGYGGFIHNFKNCVLRPVEPRYCDAARRDAASARQSLTRLQVELERDGYSDQLEVLDATLADYSANIDIVQRRRSEGRSVREIDTEVRVDDRPAVKDILALREALLAGFARQAAELSTRIGLMAGLAALVMVSVFFALLRAVQREQSEQKALSRRLEAIVDSVHSGIIGLDEMGNVVSANPRARHILGGVSTPTPFKWPPGIVFLDSDTASPLELSRSPLHRAMVGQALESEVSLMSRARGDQPRYVRVSSSPVEAIDREDVETVLIIDDVTELEKNRQQLERSGRLDALGQLTGGIAHDFNNLLSVILASVQVLQTENLSDRGKRLAENSLSATRRGAQLTTRLLAFAKRQPARAAVRKVGEVLDEFERLARPTIEETYELEFVAEDRELLVFCDTAQLEHALLNLVLNSRDAIQRSGKGAKIVVKARGVSEIDADVVLRKESPHSYIAKGLHVEHAEARALPGRRAYRYVEFAVTDDGPGMTEEVKRRAIDPFFTTKDNNSGTGLGLSMVYGFVQQAEGELRIYSEVGHGTTVRLILPRGSAEGGREEPMVRAEAARGGGQRILIVEDEPALSEALGEVIVSLGYEIVVCESGPEALERLEKDQDIALVLTDVVMPGGIDGFELARRVRAMRPALPIVYMSGYTGFSDVEMGAVVAPVVQKPAEPATLGDALKSALAGDPTIA